MEHTIFEAILEKINFQLWPQGLLPSGALSAHPTMFINKHWSMESKGMCDETLLLPSGASFLWLYNPNIFSQTRLRHAILECVIATELK
jgi:hypothetical protein